MLQNKVISLEKIFDETYIALQISAVRQKGVISGLLHANDESMSPGSETV
jgi:hypothetical protein